MLHVPSSLLVLGALADEPRIKTLLGHDSIIANRNRDDEDDDDELDIDELADDDERAAEEARARRRRQEGVGIGDWERIGWMAARFHRRAPGVEFM